MNGRRGYDGGMPAEPTAPHTPSSGPTGPLVGLKVVELGQLIAGPFAAKTLADFGAEVIKIEPPASDKAPGGDPLRQWRLLHNGTSVWAAVTAQQERELDLRQPEARALVRLIGKPTCWSNFKPGVMKTGG
jgi:formyl-CoA transferase